MEKLQCYYDKGTLSEYYDSNDNVRLLCNFSSHGLLTPARLWQFFIQNLSELSIQLNTESLVNWLAIKAFL